MPHPIGRTQTGAYANVERANQQRIAMVDLLRRQNVALLRALFMTASHCQGGHSDAGQAVSDLLGIPFPLQMDNLARAAMDHGFNPDELWPWLAEMRK